MSYPATMRNIVNDSTRSAVQRIVRFKYIALGTLALLPFASGALAADSPSKKLPKFEKIEHVIRQTLTASGVVPGDLLSRGSVAGVIAQLKKRGWNVRDGKQIIASTLPDDDFLVKRLAKPDAHNFKQRVAQLPGGYDRLDRLRRMSRGQSTVDELVRGPDGYKLIEYMTTSRGGHNLGGSLTKAPNGKDFNKPTGHIYTATQLVNRLHVSYREASKRGR